MKEILLTTLRNRKTTRPAYREATRKLGTILAVEASQFLAQKRIAIQTPLAPTQGRAFKHPVVLIPILRSGLALLPPFLDIFPEAKVGFIGMKRDEMTAIPSLYYQNLPEISSHSEILILEPMIATGNSICIAMDILKKHKIKEEKIVICSIIGSTEGTVQLKRRNPHSRLIVMQEDKNLNSQKFIEPGLGDFGDRYFGTEI